MLKVINEWNKVSKGKNIKVKVNRREFDFLISLMRSKTPPAAKPNSTRGKIETRGLINKTSIGVEGIVIALKKEKKPNANPAIVPSLTPKRIANNKTMTCIVVTEIFPIPIYPTFGIKLITKIKAMINALSARRDTTLFFITNTSILFNQFIKSLIDEFVVKNITFIE